MSHERGFAAGMDHRLLGHAAEDYAGSVNPVPPCDHNLRVLNPSAAARRVSFEGLRLALAAALAVPGGDEGRVRDAERNGAGQDSADGGCSVDQDECLGRDLERGGRKQHARAK